MYLHHKSREQSLSKTVSKYIKESLDKTTVDTSDEHFSISSKPVKHLKISIQQNSTHDITNPVNSPTYNRVSTQHRPMKSNTSKNFHQKHNELRNLRLVAANLKTPSLTTAATMIQVRLLVSITFSMVHNVKKILTL